MSQDIKRIKMKKQREDDQDVATDYRNKNLNKVDLNISNLVTDMAGQTN